MATRLTPFAPILFFPQLPDAPGSCKPLQGAARGDGTPVLGVQELDFGHPLHKRLGGIVWWRLGARAAKAASGDYR